jgi:Ca2+-binding RTX toxin-like protein
MNAHSTCKRSKQIVLVLTAGLAAAVTGAPAADAATTCTFSNAVLEVHMSAHRDLASLSIAANTQISVGGPNGPVACTGVVPATATTDTVLIVDDSDDPATPAAGDGATLLSITDPTDFSPGKTTEASTEGVSEIEFLVDPGGGRDDVVVGGERKQGIFVGNDGMSWTADTDADMLGMPFESVLLHGGSEADILSGQGGRGAGAPLSTADAFRLNGGAAGAAGQGDLLGGSNIPSGDTIQGGNQSDFIGGNAGDDTLIGRRGDDIVVGGSGTDTIRFSGNPDAPADARGVSVDLGKAEAQDTGEGADTIIETENAVGSIYADRLTGNASANVLDGSDGADTLAGRGGADELRGGPGTDATSYAQAPAAVTVDLTRTTQPTDGDRLNSIEDAIGSPFADTLTGNAVANRLEGGAGADTIAAGDGADRVELRDGEADRASCGAGPDTAIADRRTLDALEADCETLDALPEPAQPADPTTTGDPMTTDNGLTFSLSARSSQRVLRQRAVRIRVSSPREPSTIVATASTRVRAARRPRRAATRLRLRSLTKALAAGSARIVALRLTRRQLAALRKAMGAGQRPTFTVTVDARDAAGNNVRRTVRVKARR